MAAVGDEAGHGDGRTTVPGGNVGGPLLLVALGVVLLFGFLGSYRTLGSHEVFVAVPAREMLETGDWIIPRYGQVPRLQKPPLAYWVVATSAAIGGGVTELTARFPSALAAALLAILVGLWARRWYGPAAGFAAALIQLSSLWVLTYGRKAEVDILLCLLTTGALAVFAMGQRQKEEQQPEQQPEPEGKRAWWLRWIGIYLLVSLAWLAKFHYGAAMVLGPIVLYLVCQRRFGSLWHLLNPVGLAVLAAAVVIWPRAVLATLPEAAAVWSQETAGRALGGRGFDPPWDYLAPLLVLTLPWTWWLARGCRDSWRAAWASGCPRERWLWCWILAVAAILLASPSKHPNYLLGLLPALTLVGCRRLADTLGRIGWPWHPRAGPALVVTAVGLLIAVVNLQLLPRSDHRAHAAAFGQSVRASLPRGTPVATYRMTAAINGMDPVIFYLDSPARRIDGPEQLQQQLARDGVLYLVAYAETVEQLERTHGVRRIARMSVAEGLPAPRHSPLVLARVTRPGTERTAAGTHAAIRPRR